MEIQKGRGLSFRRPYSGGEWLRDANELVTLSIVDFDYLITTKKLEEDRDFVEFVNPCTKMETAALRNPNMRNLKRGDILQLERKGYFRCDVPFVRPSNL